MSLFQCENCGAVENTALSCQGFKHVSEWFDWSGIENREGQLLCSQCGPTKYSDGKPTEYGVWHGEFDRVMLPMGKFTTNGFGNLAHNDTGETDYMRYALRQPAMHHDNQRKVEV